MDIFALFGHLFQGFVNFLAQPIPLGGGITVSFYGLLLANIIFGIIGYVIYKLTD